MKRIDYITKPWKEYELIDSGEGRKLERFAGIVLDRPDPQALWNKSDANAWKNSSARFIWAQKGERWDMDADISKDSWSIDCSAPEISGMNMELALGAFKHIGLFPEHMAQWQDIAALSRKHKAISQKDARVLNLFGYTGAASIAAALAGASVTHIDASKQTIATVKRNMKLSGLPADAIRLLAEDALRYAKRLAQRGETFDIIVMDPPAFGRGPKGEVWKIEEKLPELLACIPDIIAPDGGTVILNGYAAGYSARSFGELLQSALPSGTVVYGDVGIAQSHADRVLSTGIYAKWQR